MAYDTFYDIGQAPHYYYYYYYPSPPMTFWEPSAYYLDDDNYRRHYRRQEDFRDQSRHGVMPMERVIGREVAGARPWWLSSDYGYDGYPWQYNYRIQPVPARSTVEMYVPLCCDRCERKVRKHLKELEGVESVSANQWENKVVVQGYNLHPRFLLRRVQRDKPNSVFWCDRPR